MPVRHEPSVFLRVRCSSPFAFTGVGSLRRMAGETHSPQPRRGLFLLAQPACAGDHRALRRPCRIRGRHSLRRRDCLTPRLARPLCEYDDSLSQRARRPCQLLAHPFESKRFLRRDTLYVLVRRPADPHPRSRPDRGRYLACPILLRQAERLRESPRPAAAGLSGRSGAGG